MDELMNLMIADESPSEISDSIKNQLMQKAGARVDALKPAVANAMLGYEVESEEDVESEAETVGELDNEEETEEEELMAHQPVGTGFSFATSQTSAGQAFHSSIRHIRVVAKRCWSTCCNRYNWACNNI